ncbi:hypothetical protein Lser_V15G18579 [Lactuca serriola]
MPIFSSTDSLPFVVDLGIDDVVDAGVDDWTYVDTDDWLDDVGKDDWVDDSCVHDVAPIVPTCETNVGADTIPTDDNVVWDDDDILPTNFASSCIENKFIISTKLTVEGPLRIKEEYIEGVLETPTVDEGTIPEQLKGALTQALNTMQQLPSPIKDAVSGGLRLPLNGAFQRMFMISYLDEVILILRDTSGIPEVLMRLDVDQSPIDPIQEYES